jgi:hypothetical protein
VSLSEDAELYKRNAYRPEKQRLHHAGEKSQIVKL